MIKDFKKLLEVYEFAKKAHKGQFRKTGEDYITHPVAVAGIAQLYEADEPTVYACMLHDVVEDTPIKLEEIIDRFGKEVAFLVDGVTKENSEEKTIEKIKKYSKKDSRVILIKLADRIHNLQNMNDDEIFKGDWKNYRISTPIYIEIGRQHGYNDLAQKAGRLLK